MASTLNASNSGAGGLISTADASGVLQLQSAGTTAVTIDTSQNVGIGGTPKSTGVSGALEFGPSTVGLVTSQFDGPYFTSNLYYSGGWKYASTGYASMYAQYQSQHKWYTAPSGSANAATSLTQAMTLDSSGNFLVGTTTGLDGGNGATIKQASYYISSYRVSSTAGNYVHAFYSDVGGTATAKYAIYANGTAGAISDERYKKNIEPSRNYLEDLTKINVIKYNWATDEDGTPKELGFSAQQVETIFPALVDTVDNKDADGNVLSNQKILKRDVFLPMLVKAIQEQQTIINELKTRIETLEAK